MTFTGAQLLYGLWYSPPLKLGIILNDDPTSDWLLKDLLEIRALEWIRKLHKYLWNYSTVDPSFILGWNNILFKLYFDVIRYSNIYLTNLNLIKISMYIFI